jgi:hypothetical protein
MKTNKKCSDRNDVANGSCALLSVSLYRRPFFDVSKCAARHFHGWDPNSFFGDMLTCSHVSSARNIVGGQLFRVSGNCDNIFFSPFVSFDMWRDFGLLLPVTSFVSRKVLPPSRRRLFGDQQDKNCVEETPVLTRNVTSLMFFAESFLWSVQQSSEQQQFFPL